MATNRGCFTAHQVITIEIEIYMEREREFFFFTSELTLMQSSRFGHVETAFTSHANYKGTSFRLHIVLILILKHDRKQKQFCVLEKKSLGKGFWIRFVCV